jgi:hypothetical protein
MVLTEYATQRAENAFPRSPWERGKALPSEPLIPNEETVAAMLEAEQGGLPSFSSIEALMADLQADD